MGLAFTKLFKRMTKKEVRVVMVGLDAAGKTTLLYKLKLGEVVSTIPTIGLNVETVEHQNLQFTVWDMGGQDKLRSLWKHYYKGSHGVVFVIDSNDGARLDVAKAELETLLKADELRGAVLLIYANKQDLTGAASAAQLTDRLNLNSLRQRQWYVQPCCATSGEGLYEGLEWLSATIKKISSVWRARLGVVLELLASVH